MPFMTSAPWQRQRCYADRRIAPVTSDAKNSTRKMMKRILAIAVAVPAMPPNPRSAAISAMNQESDRPAQHLNLRVHVCAAALGRVTKLQSPNHVAPLVL